MAALERPVANCADRIAADALARLPELLATNQADRCREASIGFRYIANRLFQLAALPGGTR
jgi:hypothetical protein